MLLRPFCIPTAPRGNQAATDSIGRRHRAHKAQKEEKMQIQRTIVVKGYVQRVSYRKSTQRVATSLGVTGWVRNLSNGSVEACLEGEESAVDALLAWCAFGPKRGYVEEVVMQKRTYSGRYSDFSIREDRQTQ